jgi:hypothetical protein
MTIKITMEGENLGSISNKNMKSVRWRVRRREKLKIFKFQLSKLR